MGNQQLDAAGASSSATSVYFSTAEELQPPVPVTSDTVLEESPFAPELTSKQYWTTIDHTIQNEADPKRVLEFPGTQIRQFAKEHIQLLEIIGTGGQGTIHTAHIYNYNAASGKYEPGGERFAAKVFRRNCGQWPEETFGLHIGNVYICKFYGYCVDGDSFILVMTRYDSSLRRVLDKQMTRWKKALGGRPLGDFDVVRLIIEIALGMRFLHENGILHRDLKADNILVNLHSKGNPLSVCIGDFDVSSSVVGTLFWRAPEVLQALKEGKTPIFTRQADVYSFAMTCYEILTGDIPFGKERASNYDLVLGGQRPKLPSNLNPNMKGLMERCWHQDPSVRPTFDEVVEELRALHRELLTGSEATSTYMDDIVDHSKWATAEPVPCFQELKKLLQTLLEKYKQAEFVREGCQLVADLEKYQSQFGLLSFEEQQQRAPIPDPQWLQAVVASDNIVWKMQCFRRNLPFVREKSMISLLVGRILTAASEVPDWIEDETLTPEEIAAHDAKFTAYDIERQKRILPDNPHLACQKHLNSRREDDGFQACDLCSNQREESSRFAETFASSLYVGEESTLRTFLPSSLRASLSRPSKRGRR